MQVLVLGAGVVGVTSAWYLAKAGHDVTIIDRQVDVALETSYANAGQISPGYSAPWAGPGIPVKAVKWLMQDLAPFMISGKELDTQTLSWMTKMLTNCTESAYHVNKARMVRLAEYSRDCFVDLRNELDIDYEQRTKGTLQVFRTEKQVKDSKKDISVLEESGVDFQVLDVDGCVEYEPALANVKDKIVGGLRLPGDETGDCFKFTNSLADECKKMGVKFIMKTDILNINTQGDQIESVTTSRGKMTADAYLVALGSYSTPVLSKIDLKVPVYPIKGYSLTLPIVDASKAPTSTVMDETYKVAVTRFDDRIRVGGTAEIASYNKELEEKRKANVEFVVSDLFPGGGDIEQAEFWTGLRPMTPDGTPILGETKYSNLFLNTGHGTLGWTMSLGSGKYVADIISQRQPDIDKEGLSVARYG
ncbi:D-amino acid dehydrogenase [Neptuniibacter caesariensis]|uniref:D-amino acid dehydrogenase small subunit n=1 Tax=Neptuniibacter caesariensis TaxID=207954 RepID=A0A7U8GTE2_NEPCE|nr:D-amino acid dehydrogenase [Neptuniibacter caesariensis]EAR62336.1 D-amino acid dehydrogenase small subunit [Oceanospirillum sp. MED92] [Neptuniibacter caesariensis]